MVGEAPYAAKTGGRICTRAARLATTQSVFGWMLEGSSSAAVVNYFLVAWRCEF